MDSEIKFKDNQKLLKIHIQIEYQILIIFIEQIYFITFFNNFLQITEIRKYFYKLIYKPKNLKMIFFGINNLYYYLF